ncbi:MAG: rRNA (cytidine1920-2-O)/16S rRNA (cytidine1409-2-O)-methyltransferase [Campylobacterota bacterium]|nr:rRNA (cytidine1920-2-O)/16S rRNA (cytidine1409-2-O)-methyltransferase [Campylobacterota bacterium]
MRLDCYLVENLLALTRTKAKDLIIENKVLVDGKIANKPSFEIIGHKVEIIEQKQYVSRAAKKLKDFLDKHGFDLKNQTAIDVGSSTGGFVEVLLEYGVKKVVAVDVGKEQLHQKLRDDKRVELHEETDIREFKTSERFDIVTCDASFISLNNIIETIKKISSRDIILLFKPQFEVGIKAKRDKKGVVTDQNAIDGALNNFLTKCEILGLELKAKEKSSLLGRDGNQEFILYFRVDGDAKE